MLLLLVVIVERMRETIYIYGHSDDLIQIDGALGAEFSAPFAVEDDGACVEFDNGDTFRLTYDKEWVVEQEHQLENPFSSVETFDPGEIDHLNNYSQVAVYQPWHGVDSVELVK